ncbi:MAG: RagB/SusD family nutrient uptake outer membrane protein [Prevotella sp.]|nr:RagB/SusD family nutrient uptake outer membrane protein [Prevotella sp.]
MKKIYILLLSALALASCSDDFLDKTPSDKVDPEINVTDAVAVDMANACYRTLQSSNMYNQRIWTLDIVAGNSVVGAGGGTDGLETIQASNFVTQSDNGMALYMWRSPWVGIGQCNILIKALEGKELSDIMRRSLGEAYFLRAHYYYVLVRLYGGVPLRVEPFNPGESTDIARSSVEETYNLIINDCKRALEMLPTKSELDAQNVGRATKDAALTMLADIYLTLAPNHKDYYSEVVSLCSQVESLGYNLAACSYESNFDATINNGPESIFEVQFSGNTEYDFWGNNPQSSWMSTFMGPRNSDFVAGSYGWNQPTKEMVEQYEEGDKRKDLTILYEGCPDFDGKKYKSSYSGTGYNVRKFLVPKSISPEYNTNPQNFVVYRFADVLLMKAEALNELGQTAQAAAPLNEVRYRAGLSGVSGLSQDEMREKIIHERRIELAFEGHRWFDMIRIDNGNYAINFLKSIGKERVSKERLLFPIPQTEMDANALMTQNPGY